MDIVVIIPCYNAIYLEDALKSLETQTYKNFDTIIASDNDVANNKRYKTLSKKYNASLFVFDVNKGAGVTRQRALDKVKNKYKYVLFLDSDDLLTPIALEVLYKGITKNDYDLAMSDIFRFYKKDKAMKIEARNKNHTPITWCGGKLYKIKYLYKNKIRFIDELRINEDVCFNSIAFNATDKVAIIPETTYIWRFNDKSTTNADKSLDYKILDITDRVGAATYAILELARIRHNKLDTSFLANKLINIYTSCEEGFEYKIPLASYKKYLTMLNKEIDIQTFVNTNIDEFFDAIPQVGVDSNSKMFFYRDNFITFIKNAYNITKWRY